MRPSTLLTDRDIEALDSPIGLTQAPHTAVCCPSKPFRLRRKEATPSVYLSRNATIQEGSARTTTAGRALLRTEVEFKDANLRRMGSLPIASLEIRSRVLDLSCRGLLELPEEILRFDRIQILRLDNNKLVAVPEAISQLSQLMHLSFSGNRIQRLEPAIGKLKALRTLEVQNNALKNWPEWLCTDLGPTLTMLHLHGNPAIPHVPTSFSKMVALEELGFDWFLFVAGAEPEAAIQTGNKGKVHINFLAWVCKLAAKSHEQNVSFLFFYNHFLRYKGTATVQKHPLHLACRLGCLPVVQELLDSGVAPNSFDSEGDTALLLSVRNSHDDCAKALLASPNINVCVAFTKSCYPIHAAVNLRQFELVSLMLEHPTSCLSFRDENENTMLHLLMGAFDSNPPRIQKLCERVIAAGANLNQKNGHDLAPIHFAARRRQKSAIKFALEYNRKAREREEPRDKLFNLNLRGGDHGFTTLHYIVLYLDIETLSAFLQQSANVLARDNEGRIPRAFVKKNKLAAKLLIRWEKRALEMLHIWKRDDYSWSCHKGPKHSFEYSIAAKNCDEDPAEEVAVHVEPTTKDLAIDAMRGRPEEIEDTPKMDHASVSRRLRYFPSMTTHLFTGQDSLASHNASLANDSAAIQEEAPLGLIQHTDRPDDSRSKITMDEEHLVRNGRFGQLYKIALDKKTPEWRRRRVVGHIFARGGNDAEEALSMLLQNLSAGHVGLCTDVLHMLGMMGGKTATAALLTAQNDNDGPEPNLIITFETTQAARFSQQQRLVANPEKKAVRRRIPASLYIAGKSERDITSSMVLEKLMGDRDMESSPPRPPSRNLPIRRKTETRGSAMEPSSTERLVARVQQKIRAMCARSEKAGQEKVPAHKEHRSAYVGSSSNNSVNGKL